MVGRHWIGMIALWCWAMVAQAAVTATVDRNPVRVGESFQLTVRADGGNVSRPDFDVLDPPFRVLGTTSGTQYQLINGRASETRTWTVTLVARRPGTLTIPPLSVGTQQTEPVQVRAVVEQADPDKPRDAFIEFEIGKTTAYVREQVPITVRLFFSGDLVSGNLSEPVAADAVIEQLGKQRESRTTRDGRRYRVVERRYVLFAERSGSLTIEPPAFNGEIASGGRSVFGFNQFGGNSRQVFAGAEPVELTVQPPPAGQADRWLPATTVDLNDQVIPEGAGYTVGEPFTRVVELWVDGQLHTQLEPLEVPMADSLQVYPEPADGDTTATEDGVQGRQVQRWALIPTTPGELTLPPIAVSWYDVATDAVRTARLPARTLTVAPAPASAAPTRSAPSETRLARPDPASSDALPTTPASAPTRPVMWMALAAFALLGWLMTAAAWLWSRRRVPGAKDAQTTESRRAARRELDAALAAGDATRTRQALLHWASLGQRPEARAARPTLEDIAQQLGDPDLRHAVLALDRALYARNASWSAEQLRRAVHALDRASDHDPRNDGLPPLYPAH